MAKSGEQISEGSMTNYLASDRSMQPIEERALGDISSNVLNVRGGAQQ